MYTYGLGLAKLCTFEITLSTFLLAIITTLLLQILIMPMIMEMELKGQIN